MQDTIKALKQLRAHFNTFSDERYSSYFYRITETEMLHAGLSHHEIALVNMVQSAFESA